jgi:predicted ArsR family transcriptional regulator
VDVSRGADITSKTVIRALYDLDGDREAVSAAAVALHLDVAEETVLGHLRALKAQRIFTDVRRQGERRWTTWRAGR